MEVFSLATRYLDCCKRQKALPNTAILSRFTEKRVQNPHEEKCSVEVSLDHLKDADISPLVDLFSATNSSDIDTVDVFCESHSVLSKENIMELMNAINLKLGTVHLQDISSEDILWDICHNGLTCLSLKLSSIHIQELNLIGRFTRIQTLILDFCTTLSSLQKDTFSGMPNLKSLSMRATKISNLWTTTAVLSKLPSLAELRFQNCFCCKETGSCSGSCAKKASHLLSDSQSTMSHFKKALGIDGKKLQDLGMNGTLRNLVNLDDCCISENSEVNLPSYFQGIALSKMSSTMPDMDMHTKLQNKVLDQHESLVTSHRQSDTNFRGKLRKYIYHHPSPICFEKHYRDYLIASLPNLKVLDDLPIKKLERAKAKSISSEFYEFLPYNRKHKENIASILHMREKGTSGICHPKPYKPKQLYPYGNSSHFFSRSLTAAKLGSSSWPLLQPVTNFMHMFKNESKRLRPRQFEYHPSDPCLMVFGTLDGEIVVINHENGKIVRYIQSIGALGSVLGLCWLKRYPSKLVAGSDNGSVKLFDINSMLQKDAANFDCSSGTVAYTDFEQLTSLHVNSTDDQFLSTGYSKDVALYDISTGQRLQLFTNLHQEPINVAKFANHSPFMFATSSFDRDVKMWDLRQNPLQPCYTSSSTRGNVMVCFSPDDLYLLVSAVDNEVRQLLTADGRLHLNFEIAATGSTHNYTRSYYINGRDYVITGSSDEHVLRICSAQTGKRLRDVQLEDKVSKKSMFVQSLRGDPFRDFRMSILAASMNPVSKWEIIKVDLLESGHHIEQYSWGQCFYPSSNLGG